MRVGDIPLPANQRLAKYWSVTQMQDVLMLVEPMWETWIRGGPALYGELARPPVSPFWLNLLREPGLFEDTAADFVRLNTADQKRKAAGGEVSLGSEAQAAPQPAGNSLPLSMAPAAGPPQPGAGGNPGGAGSYPMGMT